MNFIKVNEKVLSKAKSVAVRKKEQRERDEANNISEISIRVHDDDKKIVKEYAKSLLKKRLKKD